jgi:hypothetical protein
MRAVLTGQVLGLGNLRLGFRLPMLLTPTENECDSPICTKSWT